MISFRQNPGPRNYLSGREQRRMLLLVMALGMVVILMIEAGDPDNWMWFEALDQHGQAEPDLVPPGRIEPRGDPVPPVGQTSDVGVSPSPDRAPSGQEPVGRYFPGVKPSYLESVRDNAFFRDAERDAWFHLLEILEANDQKTLRGASSGRVTYTQLLAQSEEYRGELVTIRGTLRRAKWLKARSNDYGIKGYYQTWIWPSDNPDQVIVVCCVHLPERFPTGLSLSERVETTGFYFKRWPYKAQGEVLLAPTLVARTVRWWERPPRAASPRARSTSSLVLVIIAAAAFGVLFTVYVWRRTRRRRPAVLDDAVSFEAMREADAGSAVPGPPQNEE